MLKLRNYFFDRLLVLILVFTLPIFLSSCLKDPDQKSSDVESLEKPSAKSAEPSSPEQKANWNWDYFLQKASAEVHLLQPQEPVFARGSYTFEFEFVVGINSIATKGGLVFIAPPFWGWSAPQVSNEYAAGYTTVKGPANADLEFGLSGSNALVVLVKGRVLKPGEKIFITYGDVGGNSKQNSLNNDAKVTVDRFAERESEFTFKVDENGEGVFYEIQEQPKIRIYPNPARNLWLVNDSLALVNEEINFHISLLDQYGNRALESASGLLEVFKISDKEKEKIAEKKFVISEKDEGSTAVSFKFSEPGNYQARVNSLKGQNSKLHQTRDEDLNLPAESNPILILKDLQEWNGYHLYWADLHGHSNLSDGTGTPEDFYSYAKDVSGLSVNSLTDHDGHGLRPLAGENWERILNATQAARVPGKFITFFAYEWTNWTTGHKNVYFFNREEAKIFGFYDLRSDNPEKLWKCLDGLETFTISHHVGGGPIAQDWNFLNSEKEFLVEICSVHGSSEYLNCPSQIYKPKPGCFVQDALGKGFRGGILGSSDGHDGHPGLPHQPPQTTGLAGIYAEELSQEAIWKALKEKRVYATSGARILLDFKMDSTFMGQTVHSNSKYEPKFLAKVVAGEKIYKLTLFKNGQEVYNKNGQGNAEGFVFQDQNSLADRNYYYLRVELVSGQMAWSSPIFIIKDKD